MGIQVTCPNGHVFKVKEKYAGKKGLCPHCTGQVVVHVPDSLSLLPLTEALEHEAMTEQEERLRNSHPGDSGIHDSSIFDDHVTSGHSDPGTSGSLLGSSVIRHNVKCPKCHTAVPMWYAKCPHCNFYFEQR